VNPLRVTHLGSTPYRQGLALQEGLVKARAAGETGDWLLYPDHPPVLTFGRGSAAGNVLADEATLRRLGVEQFEVARGGDVTWHGPGQVVGYLVCGLDERGRDLHRFLRGIEEGLIRALGLWGIEGERAPGRTGVWVGGEKIASIGIAVRRWVSYHGFALNVAPDLRFFDLINPCGLHGIHMTSVVRRLGVSAPTLAEAREIVAGACAEALEYPGWTWAEAAEAWRLAEHAGSRVDAA
jgi:lipoyl(octanoyl) transferase